MMKGPLLWDECRSGIGKGARVGGPFNRKRPAVSVTRVAGEVAASWRKGSGSDSYLADKPLVGCACVCCGLIVSALSNCEQQSSLTKLGREEAQSLFLYQPKALFPAWGAQDLPPIRALRQAPRVLLLVGRCWPGEGAGVVMIAGTTASGAA